MEFLQQEDIYDVHRVEDDSEDSLGGLIIPPLHVHENTAIGAKFKEFVEGRSYILPFWDSDERVAREKSYDQLRRAEIALRNMERQHRRDHEEGIDVVSSDESLTSDDEDEEFVQYRFVVFSLDWPWYHIDFELLVDRYSHSKFAIPDIYLSPATQSITEQQGRAIMCDFLDVKGDVYHFKCLQQGNYKNLEGNQSDVLKDCSLKVIGDYFHYHRFKWLKENLPSFIHRYPKYRDFAACKKAWKEAVPDINPFVLHSMDFLRAINFLPKDQSGGYFSSLPNYQSHLVQSKDTAEAVYRLIREVMVREEDESDEYLESLFALHSHNQNLFYAKYVNHHR